VRSLEILVVALIVLLMIQIRQHYKRFREDEVRAAQARLERSRHTESIAPTDTPATQIVDDYIGAFFNDIPER